MAFVEIESWSIERATLAGRSADSGPPVWLQNGRGLVLRRSIAVYFSLVVHIGLIWFLAFHLGSEEIGAPKMTAAGGPLTIVALAQSQPDAMARKHEKRSEALTSQVVEFDLTQAASIPASEWSMTKLPLAESAPTVAAASATGGPARASDDEASYDPYAGAAPMRRVTALSSGAPKLDIVSLSNAERLGIELNAAQLRLLQNIIKKLPRDGHAAFLVIRISADGTIRDVRLEGSVLVSQSIGDLQTAFLGKNLSQPIGQTREVRINLLN